MSAGGSTSAPTWVQVAINLGGIGVIAHETVVHDGQPRWALLITAVVMMGLASPDLLERMLPGGRRDSGNRDSERSR